MGMISAAEMRETREERRQHEENNARREREEEQRRAAIIRAARIRDEKLLRATNQIIIGHASEADIQFILSELQAWKQLLLKVDASHARSLIDNLSSFPTPLQSTLHSLLPLFKLKTFTFTDGFVQRSELKNLLSLVQSAYLLTVPPTAHPTSLFVTKLSVFVEKISDELLSEKQILCLQRIVNDYQINILGKHNLIDNLMTSQLMASTTLNQLNPKHEITQGLNIDVNSFPAHLDNLKIRIASLPLNIDTKNTLHNVMLPGIETIINDEQTIVNHVRDHHGTLYYLNEKLPLHTDHTSSTDPEEYRLTLRRLLINFFGAAEIAYNKGYLNLFCEKISFGYCFEGRVMDVFAWITTLSDVVSFHDTMEKYFQKEYLPYAEIMTDSPPDQVVDIVLADPIVDFIMARHKNAACLCDATYAPAGKVTPAGVKKYLENIFALVSQRDCKQALLESRTLRRSLERGASRFWNHSRKELMQIKIDALIALETHIETDGESPETAAKKIKAEHPMALYGFYFNSRTKKLLNRLETENEIKSANQFVN